jgi:hypothetical protein
MKMICPSRNVKCRKDCFHGKPHTKVSGKIWEENVPCADTNPCPACVEIKRVTKKRGGKQS